MVVETSDLGDVGENILKSLEEFPRGQMSEVAKQWGFRSVRRTHAPQPCHSSGGVAGFPPRRTGFEPRSGHVGFVVDKVALGQVFSEYFGFPCQFSFHRLFHIHHHLSSGAGTIDQLAADIPSGLSLTPPQETKKKKLIMLQCHSVHHTRHIS
jgi:hypothetical protein